MAKIIKTGKRFKVVNSVNNVPVTGGSNIKTRAQAEKVARETRRRNRR